MITLQWQDQQYHQSQTRLVLIFGVGLIGHSIKSALQRDCQAQAFELLFKWNKESDRYQQTSRILQYLISFTATNSYPSQLDVVLSGGKAGFGGEHADFKDEEAAFNDLFALIRTLDTLGIFDTIRVHLFSSAGGLFEGQSCVDDSSPVEPKRAYGQAKMRLEFLVSSLPSTILTFIYRASTVYGYAGEQGRIGLVVALIRSVFERTTARIYAKPDTLRDYVFVDDIGNFLSTCLRSPAVLSQIYTLASGKPTSTLELIALTERILECRLSVQYELGNDNTSSNTFRLGGLPAHFNPTSLVTGVTLTAMRLRCALIT